MATRIRKSTSEKKSIRFKRKVKINARLDASKANVVIYKSNTNIYLQLRKDGKTLLSASTLDKGLDGKIKKSVEGAKELAKVLAEKAKAKKIDTVIFDRNGYQYHGIVKAAAEGLREAGLKL